MEIAVARTIHSNHDVAISAAHEAAGRTRFRLGIAVAVLGVLLIGIVVVFANWSSSPSPAVVIHGPDYDKPAGPTNVKLPTPGPAPKPVPEISSPPQQISFTSMVESFVPRYSAADTEIRKTNVRFERKDAIARYFSTSGALRFEEWIGRVEGLSTESDGEASLSIKLRGSNTSIKTWNNSFSDSSSHTMISRNDSLYPSLMNIKVGEEVTVSGTFILASSKPDYVEEASLTEAGSMTNPEFIVRFSQITAGRPVSSQPDNE